MTVSDGGPLGLGVWPRTKKAVVRNSGFFDRRKSGGGSGSGISQGDFVRLKDRVDKFESDLEQTVANLRDTTSRLNALVSKAETEFAQTKTNLNSLAGQVRTARTDAANAVKSAADLVKSIDEGVKAVGKTNLKSALTHLLEEATRAAKIASDASAAVAKLQQLKASIENALANAGLKDFGQFISDTRSRISDAKNAAIADARGKLDALEAKFNAKVESVKKSVAQTVTTVKCLLDTTKALIEKYAGISAVVEKLKGVMAKIGSLFDPFKTAFETMHVKLADVKDDITTGGKDGVRPSPLDAVGNAIGAITGPLKGIPAAYGNLATTFKTDAANNFGELRAKFDEAKAEYAKCKAVEAPVSPAENAAPGPVRKRLVRFLSGETSVRRFLRPGRASAPAGSGKESWSDVPEATDPEWEV